MTQQIFISYAHVDNAKLRTAQAGWVDDFDEALINELRTRGLKCVCWRDKRGIRPDQFFDEVIRQAVDTSTVFVAIVSPNYIDSKYCLDELGRFSQETERDERIMKVVKFPVDRDDPDARLPQPLQRRTGFQFFRIDRESGEELLFWNAGTDPHPQFYDTIRDVARAIKTFLPEVQRPPGTVQHYAMISSFQKRPPRRVPLASVTGFEQGPTIYLAEVSGDMEEAYRAVRGELEAKLSARILPQHPLPRDEAAAIDAIQADLGKANHSIHLLGARYGFIPDGQSGRSIVALQLEQARLYSIAASGFHRLIWSQPDRSAVDPNLQTLLFGLQAENALSVNDHLVEETLERFKSHALDVIKQSRPLNGASPAKGLRPPVLFLVCDRKDEQTALDFRRTLQRDGLHVRLPDFEGTEAELNEAFVRNAKRADGVLVLYGGATEAWVLDQLHDLTDWAAIGRKSDFKAKGVLLVGNLTARKQEFSTPLADIYDEANLAAFADDLKAGLSHE